MAAAPATTVERIDYEDGSYVTITTTVSHREYCSGSTAYGSATFNGPQWLAERQWLHRL